MLARLLAYSFLKDSGIAPRKDLSVNSFYEDRQSKAKSDEQDVVERVSSGEFDAGAMSQRAMESMAENGALPGMISASSGPAPDIAIVVSRHSVIWTQPW